MSQDLTIQFEDNVQQWEYISPVVPQEHLGPALERCGVDGWEFVQGFPCQAAVEPQSGLIVPGGMDGGERVRMASALMLIFKRPKMMLPNVNSSGLAASQN